MIKVGIDPSKLFLQRPALDLNRSQDSLENPTLRSMQVFLALGATENEIDCASKERIVANFNKPICEGVLHDHLAFSRGQGTLANRAIPNLEHLQEGPGMDRAMLDDLELRIAPTLELTQDAFNICSQPGEAGIRTVGR